jgi:hypothetical protein
MDAGSRHADQSGYVRYPGRRSAAESNCDSDTETTAKTDCCTADARTADCCAADARTADARTADARTADARTADADK